MKRNHRALAVALVPVLALGQGLAGCAGDSPAPAALDEAALGAVAEQYVKLVLSLGVHDPNYVDAYYGPEEWRTAKPCGVARGGPERQDSEECGVGAVAYRWGRMPR